MKIVKRVMTIVIVVILFCLSVMPVSASQKKYSEAEILKIADGIIKWKKLANGSMADGFLINSKFLELAGTTPGDWYPIGLGRLQIPDDYDGYLAVIKDVVEKRYRESGKLSSAKSTEWHRISLAILAMGGDPTNFGTDEKGNPINLIADGIYNRGYTISLGRQGINGWIWGLITLDAKKYEIPSNAYYTRDDIIFEILKKQLPDGGFALTGSVSDPDITAMAVQALAPYDDSNQKVQKVIDDCVNWLSKVQLPTGDYQSWGTQNVESTAQVAVALCCLGIDVQADKRFIKNGNSLIDGIMRYAMSDGGFLHSFVYDKDNPTSLPDESNTMAGEQVLYTMAAIYRQMNHMNTLYDFTGEKNAAKSVNFTSDDKETVDSLPSSLTTENYVDVVKLLTKIKRSDDFDGKAGYISRLEDSKKKIIAIQKEIDDINAAVKEKLYPFEKITLKDKKTVEDIVKRYNSLSAYDQAKIDRYEDVIKTKTKLDNKVRAILIFEVLLVLVIILSIVTAKKMRQKMRRKALEMEELERMYGDTE